jgi:hypothetical protein
MRDPSVRGAGGIHRLVNLFVVALRWRAEPHISDTVGPMTTLRFTDPEGSDLYLYESSDGFVTYVAGVRYDTGETIDGLFDNMMFKDATVERLRTRLEILRSVGYRIPERVFSEIS